MASHFDRWEKDPFFSAAEEVQESADRMESTYRTWIHALKDTSGSWNCDALRRDLRTTLGTAKWQLEEFDRAVRSSYNSNSADDARDRHHEFVIAIDSQIKKVENSLNESAVSQGKPPLPWVHLDEGEVNELAAFLSGPSTSSAGITHQKVHGVELQTPKWDEGVNQSVLECSENHPLSENGVRGEVIDEKFLGHRRTASASADIGAWQVAVGNDVSIKEPAPPPRRIPSYQGLLNAVESVKELKWTKNGYRKLKFNQEADHILPRTQPPTRNINTCYERNKSCLDCSDDCYDKQLYGWYGAIQRQLQRSQYYMQYRRPVRIVLSVFLLIFLIGLKVELSQQSRTSAISMAFLFHKFQEVVKVLAKSPTFARESKLVQFEADINLLFLYTSYNRLGRNAEEDDAEEIIDMANKASIDDQQKLVHENVHHQVSSFCRYMDDILLLDQKVKDNQATSPTTPNSSPCSSGLGLAVGGNSLAQDQTVAS